VTAFDGVRQIFMPLMRWWFDSPIGVEIRNYSALIAITQSVHLVGLTMLAGTLLIVNLRLMDIGFVRHPTARIARELAPWTSAGLVILLASGTLILSSEALKCYESTFFWTKMTILLVAILFHFTVHRRVTRSEPPAPVSRRRAVACLSLTLWIGVALAGKMIGIYGDDLREDRDPFHPDRNSFGHAMILPEDPSEPMGY
jgi:hypothetical protein